MDRLKSITRNTPDIKYANIFLLKKYITIVKYVSRNFDKNSYFQIEFSVKENEFDTHICGNTNQPQDILSLSKETIPMRN